MALISADNWLRATPDERPEKVAARALRTRLARVEKCLKRAAKPGQSNPKYVHALRVSTRRANAALKLFKELLPPKRAAWMTKQLGRLRRAAGEARELDVLAQRLANGVRGKERKQLVEHVRRQRSAAQKPIARIHKRLRRGDEFKDRSRQLVKRTLKRGKHSNGKTRCFGDWARSRLKSLAASFLQADATDVWNPEIWHSFRIEAKALRYSLELLSGAFSTAVQSDLYPLVVELQERLGEINDLATTSDRVHATFSKSPLDTNAALRQWTTGQQLSLEKARDDFLNWYQAGVQDALRQGLLHELPASSANREPAALC